MKVVVLVGDGMGDHPIEELGKRTPLQAANIPTMRKIAAAGDLRMVQTVPDNLPPGSDVANMALMGYNASENYTGRAPIEAAGADIIMDNSQIAFRCNLVTITNDKMTDYSAGHISTEEAKGLIDSLQKQIQLNNVKFYSGIQYRHLLIWDNGPNDLICKPPHEISDQNINQYLPSGSRSDELIEIMEKSKVLFRNHPINQKRIKEGKAPATQIWLWGQGASINLDSYSSLYGLNGGVVSAVDLLKGLAKLSGLTAPNIKGATGLINTNYEGKVNKAISILEKNNFVYLHIEAPDECGHMGDYQLKIKAIELFDQRICAPMLKWLESKNEEYILILCMDHRTPVALKGHTSEPVPMVVLHGPTGPLKEQKAFDENVNNGIAECMAYKWVQQILTQVKNKE